MYSVPYLSRVTISYLCVNPIPVLCCRSPCPTRVQSLTCPVLLVTHLSRVSVPYLSCVISPLLVLCQAPYLSCVSIPLPVLCGQSPYLAILVNPLTCPAGAVPYLYCADSPFTRPVQSVPLSVLCGQSPYLSCVVSPSPVPYRLPADLALNLHLATIQSEKL